MIRQNLSSLDQRLVFGEQPVNQQRLAAYLELIKTLLDCPEGQELALLQANAELVDAALVQVMDQVAIQMIEQNQREAAIFLEDWAEELRNTLKKLLKQLIPKITLKITPKITPISIEHPLKSALRLI